MGHACMQTCRYRSTRKAHPQNGVVEFQKLFELCLPPVVPGFDMAIKLD
jgi:hypothetical protein